MENTPSTTTSTPPPSSAARWRLFSSLSRRPWRNGRRRARLSRQPSRIEAWSAESAMTVSPGSSSVPSVPTFVWWPVVKTIAASAPTHRPHPPPQLPLELQVQGRGAVEQPRAGQARAVAVQGVVRGLDHPGIAREAEVVVGAEHDPLGALHLDDGQGR